MSKIEALRIKKNLFRSIAYGYLIKNYSKPFVLRCKEKIRPNRYGMVEICCKYTGNCFYIKIDIEKKTIEHFGPYDQNKGFDSKAIIEYNLNKVQNG